MTALRCSVVVPVIPAHIKYIKALLEELSPAKSKIVEIIFCASSQTAESERELRETTTNSAFNGVVIIESTEEKLSAGENRNVGWRRAKGDYICFLDADDSYNPYMFNIFEYYFESLGCDLILHDYFRFTPQVFLRMNRSLIRVETIDSGVLSKHTFSERELGERVGLNQTKNTNIMLPPRLRRVHRVQHGHATVKREVPLRYSNRPSGEDGEFAQQMLLKGYQVIYLPLRLSNYDRPTFSNLLESSLLRVIERLSKLKKGLIFGSQLLLRRMRAR